MALSPDHDFWANLEWRTRGAFVDVFGEPRVLDFASPEKTASLTTISDKYRYLQSIARAELDKYDEIQDQRMYIKPLKSLAWAYDWNRQWEEAVPLWRKCNENSPPTKPSLPYLCNLAESLVYTKQPADGEAMYRIMLPLLISTIGPNCPQVIGAYRHLGQAVAKQGRDDEAKKIFNEAKDLAHTIEDDTQRREALEEIEGSATLPPGFQAVI